ncbi:MAG: A/G-specific adenine glycosylase [Patescibacteria group bacterium]
MMLQQTQVDRVVPKYKSFLKKFPTLKHLANAKQSAVVKEWQGLGYNRRALYLKRAAEHIVKNYGGRFPNNPIELEKLPGVGPYTARAVCTFAWNEPSVFIETNIRRVYIHFFFARRKRVSDKEIIKVIQKTLPSHKAREWYWALMDYGSSELKKIPNPNHKSVGYTRQSKFEGSQRYARAKMLKLILNEKRITLKRVRLEFKDDPLLHTYKPEEILKALTQEGFIRKSGNIWCVV